MVFLGCYGMRLISHGGDILLYVYRIMFAHTITNSICICN